MHLLPEAGQRLKEERERNRLTVAQAAVLSGVTPEQWQALESGLICMHIDFSLELRRIGFNARYIGLDDPENRSRDERFIKAPETESTAVDGLDETLLASPSWNAPDSDSFSKAIELMRRSIAAVDAFVGEGAASKSPTLVAALMNATIQGQEQENAQQVAVAIENAAGVVGDAIDGASELFKEVVDDAIDALTQPGGR